jgi:hypothetical protein
MACEVAAFHFSLIWRQPRYISGIFLIKIDSMNSIYLLKKEAFRNGDGEGENILYFRTKELRDKAFDIIKKRIDLVEADSISDDKLEWSCGKWSYFVEKDEVEFVSDIEEQEYGLNVIRGTNAEMFS